MPDCICELEAEGSTPPFRGRGEQTFLRNLHRPANAFRPQRRGQTYRVWACFAARCAVSRGPDVRGLTAPSSCPAWAGTRCASRRTLGMAFPTTPASISCSYYVDPAERAIVAATTDYGRPLPVQWHGANIFAVQFHPEKAPKPDFSCFPTSSAGSHRAENPQRSIPSINDNPDMHGCHPRAIDLKDGSCVRPQARRDGGRDRVFRGSRGHGAPLIDAGARRLHLVGT